MNRISALADAPELLRANISADYPNKAGVLRNVSFTVRCAEILGLIGQSGSGKSTIALAIPRLLELRGGKIHGALRFCGRDMLACDAVTMRGIRGREIGFVPQSPMSALNPALRIETQLREAWRAHRAEAWPGARETVRALLVRMGLPADNEFLRRYPRQLSVGQAQRVVIAMAVMHRPKLLIADEATSALDPTSRNEILALFASLNMELQMAILYVSHDLASVAGLCHTVGILQAGQLIASGPAAEMLAGLQIGLPAGLPESRPFGEGSAAGCGQDHEAALHVIG